jgi:hypothetical protein
MIMEQTSYSPEILPEDKPFSIKDELQKWVTLVIQVIRQQWKWLVLAAIAGAVIGTLYAWYRPVAYTARTTFVVEESKMGAGALASLAGQFGLDLGGLAGNTSSGLLGGDNVMELVKSHELIRKTLLSVYDSAAPTLSLADKYAEVTHWKTKWANSSKVGKMVSFPAGAARLGRTEDSLLQKIVNRIIRSDLAITKPDRKLGFFELSISMRDERLSLLFSQRLLKAAADFYIDTKTRHLTNNVNRLQAKADSLGLALNRKTYSAADAQSRLLDVNPAFAAPEASAEIIARDKYVQATIYAEIIKNLEISRTALIQETPTIQVVDSPEVPLKDNQLHWWLTALAGVFLSLLLTMLICILTKKFD